MRVAALYDVHGMPWALEAVLAEVNADAIVFGGDLVWGPYPHETLAMIRALDAVAIRGNADRDLGEWVAAQLTDEERDWLQRLPQTQVLDDVFYCHASPRSDEDVITPKTPDDVLDELLAPAGDARLIVGGHTHLQQRRGRYVNAGSVGMPYEDDVAAFWAVISDDVEFRRTSFDVEHAIAETRRSGWPQAQAFVDENLVTAPSRDEAIALFRPAGT